MPQPEHAAIIGALFIVFGVVAAILREIRQTRVGLRDTEVSNWQTLVNEQQETIGAKQETIDGLRDRQERLEGRMDLLEQTCGTLIGENLALKERVTWLEAQLRAAQDELKRAYTRIEYLCGLLREKGIPIPGDGGSDHAG